MFEDECDPPILTYTQADPGMSIEHRVQLFQLHLMTKLEKINNAIIEEMGKNNGGDANSAGGP